MPSSATEMMSWFASVVPTRKIRNLDIGWTVSGNVEIGTRNLRMASLMVLSSVEEVVQEAFPPFLTNSNSAGLRPLGTKSSGATRVMGLLRAWPTVLGGGGGVVYSMTSRNFERRYLASSRLLAKSKGSTVAGPNGSIRTSRYFGRI